jgi:multiple sugar transport system substrate-binding protein
MKRRTFVKASAAAGLQGILASRMAPAFAQGTALAWIRWNDFVPASDQLLRSKIIPEAQKALGVRVTLETVNGNDLQPRATSAIQSGSGPDIFFLLNNWAQLYADSTVDVSDVAEKLAKEQGGVYPTNSSVSKAGSRWIGMPWATVGLLIAYRKSWLAEVGYSTFPDTWEKYLDCGKKLKAKGHPIGQTLGHTFGDAPAFWYPYLWSWGGREVDEKGKVVLDSKATVDSVRFMTGFWKDAHDEGGLAWDDTNNNRAFLSGEIAATLNGASIYIESLRKPDQYKTDKGGPMKDDIAHAALPKGPAGQFSYHVPFTNTVMKYSKNVKAAKEFLTWLHSKPVYEQWFVSQKGFSVAPFKDWEKHPMWAEDPIMTPFKTATSTGRMMGYAGPPDKRAAEVISKYIITDMYAKAVQGMKPEEAVKSADGELRKIYGQA